MRKVLRVGQLLIFILMIVFAGSKLYGICKEYAEGTRTYDRIAGVYVTPVSRNHQKDGEGEKKAAGESGAENDDNENMVPVTVDFSALKNTCDDVVAWIYCEGTQVNYPVVQGDDNSYYLDRMMDGRQNQSGTLFMDCRNQADFSDWNTLVYGHNMHNGSMFAALPKYMEQEFYEEHPVWYLVTEDRNYRIELLGGYETPADSDAYSFPQTKEERDALRRKADTSSTFQADVEFQEDDRLITMSTCVYDYEDARYVLVGILREVKE